MPAPIIVFLHDARYDRVYQAVSLVAAASHMGRPAYLCLFYDALASLVGGTWDDVATLRADDGDPPWRVALALGFAHHEGPLPTEILAAARAEGCKVFACTTSVRMMDLDPVDVAPKVDAMLELADMLELAGEGALTLYI
jgi:peroxiredoxin family protein